MSITKRNHYNPCFWTALWNPDYYQAVVTGAAERLSPRERKVWALNVKADHVHHPRVDNVHYDKHLGWAEVTLESALAFCRRHHPDHYEDFARRSSPDQYPVSIDFEDIWTRLEQTQPYQVLLEVVKRQNLASPEERGLLADFVFLQTLRSHAIMNSMIEWNLQQGIAKFEYFVKLKWWLSDADLTYPPVAYLALALWTLYRTENDTFPLTDSPVLVRPDRIMVALSPRLLLEISPRLRGNEAVWQVRETLEPRKLAEFRRRTIGNTFREIIFSDRSLLERWQATPEFRQRVIATRQMKSYNRLVIKKQDGELWLINALGNQ